MNETSGRTPLGDHVGTDQENVEPARRLDIRGDQKHGCDAHCQPEQRELKDQLPIYISTLLRPYEHAKSIMRAIAKSVI